MSTTSQLAVRIGAGRPRVETAPEFRSSAGTEVAELAAAAGLELDDWQRYALNLALGERDDGSWAAFEVALLTPRQNGKGAILEARELAGLFLFGEQLLLHSAHEFKTAQEAFLRILFLVENNDDFRRKVKRVRSSHGEEGIELITGQRLRFVARSTSSGRGFSGDLVVLDESFALTPKMKAALLPTLSARPNPQIWYTSSAGDETAIELAAIRKRGHEGSARMAYLEWSAQQDVDLDDRDAWAQANPGLGIRISEEYVANEREALSDADFARERLGIWRAGAREPAISQDKWADVQDPSAAPRGSVTFSVDVLPDRSAACIVAAGEGVVEVVDHRPGVTWVSGRVGSLAKGHNGDVVIDDNGPASSIADDIEEEGVRVHRLNGPEFATACARFYDAVVSKRLRVRPNALLTAAVAGAVKRPFGERFVWSRTRSTADITPLVAASLAAYVTTENSIYEERGLLTL